MAAERKSDKTVPDMDVYTSQRCGTEFLHVEKMAPTDIHQHLLNVSGDQTVDVSTVRQWVVHFSSGESDSGLLVLVWMFMSLACRFLLIAGKNA